MPRDAVAHQGRLRRADRDRRGRARPRNCRVHRPGTSHAAARRPLALGPPHGRGSTLSTTTEPTKTTFRELGILPETAEALESVGIVHPFPIQEMTLPVAMTGHDVIGQAKTGTGKTLGFGLPLIERVVVRADVDAGRATEAQLTESPQALIVVPTRELCTQVTNDLQTAGKVRNVRVLAVYGGRAYEPQVEALRQGVDIVVGTPGRLLDLAGQKKMDLSKVRALVLDEADEMLDLGFLPDVEKILTMLPAKRQTLLFSATMPGQVISLARRYMSQPTHIRAAAPDDSGHTVASVTQHIFRAHSLDKVEMVSRILQAEGRGLVMIFCRTKRTAADVADQLTQRGFAAGAVHGDLGQGAREQALRAFRNGKVDVLVCTDVAARGIDVEGVTHVINYQCPEDEKTYLHRIGRTGRAGASGTAVTLVDWDDIPRWQLINKALELTFNEPEETYSTSPHLYELLKIAPGTRGVLPRSERTRAGLAAEEVEDLGETGGRGARSGRSDRNERGDRNDRGERGERGDRGERGRGGRGRRGGEHGAVAERPAGAGAGVAAGVAGAAGGGERAAGGEQAPAGEERVGRTRNRRRTRGGASASGAEAVAAAAVPSVGTDAAAVAAAPVAAADGEAAAPRRRRRRSRGNAAAGVAAAAAGVGGSAEPVAAVAPGSPVAVSVPSQAGAPVVESAPTPAPVEAVAVAVAAEAVAPVAKKATRTRKAAAPKAAAVETAEPVATEPVVAAAPVEAAPAPRKRAAKKAVTEAQVVVEEAPAVRNAPAKRATRKADAAVETAAEEVPAPRKRATKKAAAAAEATVEVPGEEAPAAKKAPAKRAAKKADAAVETAAEEVPAPRKRATKKAAAAAEVTAEEAPAPRKRAAKKAVAAVETAVEEAPAAKKAPAKRATKKAVAAEVTAEETPAPRKRAPRKAAAPKVEAAG
ncbi:DEAD/DEAH box helicase [Streptomyces tateyamensis]|uniref:RNA helicase n=2 Tax=Streptomyces tateyamensis TaxID=565073 RepID=A0A2V4N466_9ACTN|nr:DEAD/DEAH box helicase [Streptomyces tateyamensis]PYC63045.1 DEAD/DEAH box helicase [Streptomyces tateyamensis]